MKWSETDYAVNCLIGIPHHMHRGIIDYVDNGLKPGDFLLAVFENKFYEVCKRADSMNKQLIIHYMTLLEYIPSDSWGSPEIVKAWIENGEQLGIYGDSP